MIVWWNSMFTSEYSSSLACSVPFSNVVWSLTSNREWGLRFGAGTDFGLYHIDLDNDRALSDPSRPLKPLATPAAAMYREIIQRRGVG